MSEGVSASQRYREITGRVDEAVQRTRARDKERARQLELEVERNGERLARAADRERLVRMSVETQWETAVEALWDERWLTIKPLPKPAESVPAADQNHFDGEVERTRQALEEVLAKRTLLRPRKRD
ncbi:hypothetical protein NLX83_12935 [Allokutzneria sp. A3M-2-11 16]|uniref:hypothetical protein n=1 Tax=Allokutzneria sp. A3M-2-11 16 TaxID=2962043 RepID=UPI0020B6C467|nr:hypothetical protein [Allokutzneria sp. A3M-2-11 16]MCP3800164.1 hypothetical protein [Allokutzneria sp. A3M-2-11 16]